MKPNKAFLDKLSFQQLEKLVKLEDEIDHLKIDFKYKKNTYQLVYTPYHKDINKVGLLQLLQQGHDPHPKKIQGLANKLSKSFKIPDQHAPIIKLQDLLMIDFYLETAISTMDFKKFFNEPQHIKESKSSSKELSKILKRDVTVGGIYTVFENISIYAEYHNLTELDMAQIALIPQKHVLNKSKTYQT